MGRIAFSADDPFPLLENGKYTYAEEQEYSSLLDEYFGFRIPAIEKEIASKYLNKEEQLWLNLAPKSLQTPYTEFRSILHLLQPQDASVVVDLGAAYGRLAFVLYQYYPKLSFVGYEFVEERVAEGNRCFERFSGRESKISVANLSDPKFVPNEADYYFLYDFGSRQSIEKTLENLKQISKKKKFTVIGRGGAVRDVIGKNHPWLTVQEAQHFPHFSLYRS